MFVKRDKVVVFIKNFKIIWSYSLVILWMGLIFYFSHQPGVDSGSLSGGISQKILTLVEDFTSKDLNIKTFDFIVRKGAHFSIYFVLSLLVMNALRASGVRGYRAFIIAFVLCVLYAATDEFHQTFIPGRSGELKDVAIDSLGSLFGLTIYGFLKKEKYL